jgi:predicted MPP superfamily phosphohydrolase
MKIPYLKQTVLLLLAMMASAFALKDNPSWQRETKDKPLRIVLISDLNASYGSTHYPAEVADVIRRIAALKPDLVLCGGDMVAGQKATLTAENITAMWQSFNQVVLKPLHRQQIPFGFTVGNHDASPGFIKDRTLAEKFWIAEKESTGLTFVDSTHYPFYFSYLKNNVFMMSWDAAAAKIKPEVQEWVKAQLHSEVAKKARFRLLIGHLPLYAIVASKNKPGEVNADADRTLQFFKENGIDMYISGHQHAYFPAHKNGVQLLNLGCIGDGPRALLDDTTAARKAYTLIEVPVKRPQNFKLKTFNPTGHAAIKLRSLPDSVIGFNGVIKRKDKN